MSLFRRIRGLHTQLSLAVILSLACCPVARSEPLQDSEARRRAPDTEAPNGFTGTWLSDSLPQGAIARIGTLNWRVGERVEQLAYSPDGSILACSTRDGSIRLFDARTGKLRRVFWTEPGAPCTIAISPNGKKLASYGRSLRIWEIPSGVCRILRPKERTVEGADFVTGGCVAFPSDQTVVAANPTSIVRYDAATGEVLSNYKIKADWSVALDPTGCFLVTRSRLLTTDALSLWNAKTGTSLCTIHPAVNPTDPVAFSRNGATVVLLTAGGFYATDTTDKPKTRRFNVPGAEKGVVAVSPDGDLVVLEGDGGTPNTNIRLLSIGTGNVRRVTTGPWFGHGAMTFSPDGKFLASTWAGGTVLAVIDLATGSIANGCPTIADVQHSIAMSADGRVVTTGSVGLTVSSWNAESAQLIQESSLAGRGKSGRLVVSANGRLTALVDEKSTAIFDMRSRRWISGDAANCTYPLVVSRDDKRIFAAHGRHPICRFDPLTNVRETLYRGHTDDVTALALSPNGQMLAGATADGRLRIWDAESGRELRSLAGHTKRAEGATFSPSGDTIASYGYDYTLRLWSVSSGKELRQWRASADPLVQPVYLAHGKLIALASRQSIQLWNVADGTPLLPIIGHPGAIRVLAASTSGGKMASVSDDGSVVVWDVAKIVDRHRNGVRIDPECWKYLWDAFTEEPALARHSMQLMLSHPVQAIEAAEAYWVLALKEYNSLAPLIRKLGDTDYRAREDAQKAIEKLGESAILGLLHEASLGSDAETRARVRALLRKLPVPVVSEREFLAQNIYRLVHEISRLPESLAGAQKARRLLRSTQFQAIVGGLVVRGK